MGMKNITVKTLVDEKFRFLARDLNGSVFVFENEPRFAKREESDREFVNRK